ncbi:MAG: tRNA 4-thiouridine(8) synthase ThiI [Parcubacteria group bacterium]|nr:tRNA 4-thiouridine(8) synthase ThiI [Parcubacteria group bacterium]
MSHHILAYYGEIALKGRNRDRFEKKLIVNIKASRAGDSFFDVRRFSGRILIELKDDYDREVVVDALQKVYGIVYFMFMKKVSAELDVMRDAAIELSGTVDFETFAVRARRQNKLYKHSSSEIQQFVGGALDTYYSDKKVDLTNPDVTFFITVVEKQAFVGCERVEGAGGLPVGVSGRVLVLLSGGIDSPVAASLMQKRGCPVDFIHFHNAPYTSEASIEKARELAKIISHRQKGGRLFLVSLTDIQKAIVKSCDQKYRVLLYRRAMLRIAQEIARRENIQLLVTGDSLAQVASQTVENLAAVDAAIEMSIMRPLIGMDKQEVIDIARHIGTYEESVLPHDDCCSYFMPHQPATRSFKEDLEKQDQLYDADHFISSALDNVTYKMIE